MKPVYRAIAPLLLVSAFALGACAPAASLTPTATPMSNALPTATPTPRTTPTGSLSVPATQTAFGFKLFQEVAKAEPRKNVVLSGTSVATALAMTYNGASGDTQTAMARVLGIEGASVDAVNAAYKAWQTAL